MICHRINPLTLNLIHLVMLHYLKLDIRQESFTSAFVEQTPAEKREFAANLYGIDPIRALANFEAEIRRLKKEQ